MKMFHFNDLCSLLDSGCSFFVRHNFFSLDFPYLVYCDNKVVGFTFFSDLLKFDELALIGYNRVYNDYALILKKEDK